MHLIKFTTCLFVSILVVFASSAIHGDAADPLYNICPTSASYTRNSMFRKNLDYVINTLATRTASTGFATSVVGKYGDYVYGLAMCRGDVVSEDCKSCMVEAVHKLRQVCPKGKQGIIWYDYCMVKYSDVDFISKIDTENKVYMWNVQNITHAALFKKKLGKLMNYVSKHAVYSDKLFATGEVEFMDSVKIYGLAQCTKDLSGESCAACLKNVISDLPSCCDAKQGGRVLTGSCNIRYEIYPFYKG